jgi:hypothetical protein
MGKDTLHEFGFLVALVLLLLAWGYMLEGLLV